MCLIPKLYVAAIYGDVQQQDPTDSEPLPEDTPADEPLEPILVRIGLTSAEVANDLGNLGVAATTTPSTEIVFWCDDVDTFYDHALAAGGTPVVPPVDSTDNRLRFAWLRDPDAHQLKLVQNRSHG
jgi:hypothetical protein